MLAEKEVLEFLNNLKVLRKSENTINTYKQTLYSFFGKYLTDKKPGDITLKDVMGFDTFLMEQANKRREKGFQGFGIGRQLKTERLSRASMNLHYSALRQFLNGVGMVNLSKQIKSLPIDSHYNVLEFEDLVRACSKNTIEDFYLSKIKSGREHPYFGFYVERLRLVLVFLLSHGVRIAEACDVRKSALKTDRKKPILIIEHGKGDKQRVVPISKEWWAEWFIFQTNFPFTKQSEWLFTDRNGNRLQKSTIQTYINELGHFAGIDGLSAHKFRHGFSYLAYEASGHDLQYVQVLLGHSSINSTTIYTKTFGSKVTDKPNPFDEREAGK